MTDSCSYAFSWTAAPCCGCVLCLVVSSHDCDAENEIASASDENVVDSWIGSASGPDDDGASGCDCGCAFCCVDEMSDASLPPVDCPRPPHLAWTKK